jgi:2,4-dichlorophenol 6-monooxygenase
MEMGFTYTSGALVDDGSKPAWRDPMGAEYRPTTRPGSRLPHVWLDCAGARRSTQQLIPQGGFLLLTGMSGSAWCSAANEISEELGVKIAAYRIGERGDACDPASVWVNQREVADDGVVLVRPDGHVGFRSVAMVKDPHASLLAALQVITFRERGPRNAL